MFAMFTYGSLSYDIMLQERKTLEEGLSRQIDNSNKGFQLLSKMGFKYASYGVLSLRTQARNGSGQGRSGDEGATAGADTREYVLERTLRWLAL